MKAVIQRVSSAQVSVDGSIVSVIDKGLLTLLGIERGDTQESVKKMIMKISELRIFSDDAGKMNLSLKDINGSNLIISQFTLAADCSTGRRPSFTTAEAPSAAKTLYGLAIEESSKLGIKTLGGVFQADMKVSLTNDGPVTFVLEA